MTSFAETKKVIKGGSFLLEDHDPQEVFTPEDISDEHRMIAQTAREFTEKEVLPLDEEIESKDYKLTRELLRKAGELGLLSIDIPEKFGGAGLDLLSSLVASENMSGQASFSGTLGAHTTIGTLPIVYFGTEEQKKKYLPEACDGRACRRLRSDGIRLGLGRARREDEGGAFGRRQTLRAQRPEDVDHQRRVCGCLHRLCES